MTICSQQNFANAKFMNLKMDDRPIEHEPSTKLLGVHIDDTLIWDDQIKHMLYLATKLTDRTLTIVMLYGVTTPKHVLTNCKSYKIERHRL